MTVTAGEVAGWAIFAVLVLIVAVRFGLLEALGHVLMAIGEALLDWKD